MLNKLFLALATLTLCACANADAERPQASDAADVIRASYPEGPLWQGERLYYAEMGADRVTLYEGGHTRAFFVQEGCGPTAIAPYGHGFLVLCHIGERVVAVDAGGNELRRWIADDTGYPLRDPNDCYADGKGGVYFSDPGIFSKETRPHGYVMHLTADGHLTRATGVLWYPNGVYVDQARNIAYVDEHMAGRVLQYDIAADGMLTNQRTFVDLAGVTRQQRFPAYRETGPDGLEMGPDGDLWVSIYGEGHILRFSPQGQLVGSIEEPTQYLTNIAFNAHGDAATTGSFDNENEPFPGQVHFHPASTLQRQPE